MDGGDTNTGLLEQDVPLLDKDTEEGRKGANVQQACAEKGGRGGRGGC